MEAEPGGGTRAKLLKGRASDDGPAERTLTPTPQEAIPYRTLHLFGHHDTNRSDTHPSWTRKLGTFHVLPNTCNIAEEMLRLCNSP